METTAASNTIQPNSGQENFTGQPTPAQQSVVGNQQASVAQTGANSTVLGGSFDELKDTTDPREPEIQSPSPSSVPSIGQPEVPKPEIEPQVHQPEIQQPLGDEGYASNDGDSDGSGHSEDANLNGQTGYNELNKDAPIQNPTRTDEPSVTEETEDFPR